MKLKVILIAAVISSCSQSNNSTTELEGDWETECISGFTDFVIDPIPGSDKIVVSYKGNNTYTLVNSYKDNNCLQLELSVAADQSGLFAEQVDMPISFKVGNSITSSNGVEVKEIDFETESGATVLNVYLLRDNGNTLYFGMACTENTTDCINGRPNAVSSFSFFYTKIN